MSWSGQVHFVGLDKFSSPHWCIMGNRRQVLDRWSISSFVWNSWLIYPLILLSLLLVIDGILESFINKWFFFICSQRFFSLFRSVVFVFLYFFAFLYLHSRFFRSRVSNNVHLDKWVFDTWSMFWINIYTHAKKKYLVSLLTPRNLFDIFVRIVETKYGSIFFISKEAEVSICCFFVYCVYFARSLDVYSLLQHVS